MKKLFTLLFPFLTTILSFAQDPDQSIEEEMFSFYDSTRVVLTNSRTMVFKYIEENNPEKVKAILRYVDRKLNPFVYQVFSNDEKELIHFFLARYEEILMNPKPSYERGYRYGYHYDHYEDYYPDIDYRHPINLDVVIAYQTDNILEAIQTSNVSPEEQAFLTLYFKYKVNYREDLTMEAVQFINDYPESEYLNFVKEYIRRWYVRGDDSFDVYIGGGQSLLSGDLEESILHRSSVFYGVDGTINRIMVGARMSTTYGEILNEFSHEGDAFTDGMPIYTFNYSLTVGYAILDLDFLRITPSVDFGGIYTSVPERKKEEFPEEPSIGSITYGFGGAIDIFPFQFANSGFTNELFRLGVRLHGGRYYNNLVNKNDLLAGHQDYFGLSIILDGGTMKIDMN